MHITLNLKCVGPSAVQTDRVYLPSLQLTPDDPAEPTPESGEACLFWDIHLGKHWPLACPSWLLLQSCPSFLIVRLRDIFELQDANSQMRLPFFSLFWLSCSSHVLSYKAACRKEPTSTRMADWAEQCIRLNSSWREILWRFADLDDDAPWGRVSKRRRSSCQVHYIPVNEGFHIMNVIKPGFKLSKAHLVQHPLSPTRAKLPIVVHSHYLCCLLLNCGPNLQEFADKASSWAHSSWQWAFTKTHLGVVSQLAQWAPAAWIDHRDTSQYGCSVG